MFVIAGPSGKTGRVVAETLLSQGKAVCVLVRNIQKGVEWRRRGAKVVVASLDDHHAMERALAGATGFFTLLPEDVNVPDFDAHRRQIAEATCAAVKVHQVPHVVFLSGAAAVLSQGNGLARELHHMENLLLGSASKVTSIRAVAFQENVGWALHAARSDGIYPNFYPSAEVAFPTVATRDIGHLAADCLVHTPPRSEIIDLFGPVYSPRRVAEKLGAALGQTLRIVDIPASKQVAALIGVGLPRTFAESLAELIACLAAGRVSPRGDRAVAGTTELEDILPGLIASAGLVSDQVETATATSQTPAVG